MGTAQLTGEKTLAAFARHETFPPRNGWLKKGFDAFTSDPNVFNREDAPIILGVGKNMAKAIRYWCIAFKLADEVFDKTTRTKSLVPSEFGSKLLADDGWDPYLEDRASLWMLHWKLLKQPCLATTWHFAFNCFRHPEFSTDEFFSELNAFTLQTWPDSSFSESTLKNDISCLTRMYCKEDSNKSVSEETISSPFADLNLLTRMSSGKHFAFHIGSKTNLPAAIVTAACLEYAGHIRTSERSVNMSQLLYGTGSPGLVLKLSESALYAALEAIATKRKDITLSDTAGIVQLQFTGDPFEIAEKVLSHHYASKGR